MPKFIVTVTRYCCQTKDIEVEAEDEDDAFAVASDEAPNHDFSGLEKNAEYDVQAARLKCTDMGKDRKYKVKP
jgi:hypothetical protein